MTDEVTICPGVEKLGWGGRNFTSRILESLSRGVVWVSRGRGLVVVSAARHVSRAVA
jgi:hypothetical protein